MQESDDEDMPPLAWTLEKKGWKQMYPLNPFLTFWSWKTAKQNRDVTMSYAVAIYFRRKAGCTPNCQAQIPADGWESHLGAADEVEISTWRGIFLRVLSTRKRSRNLCIPRVWVWLYSYHPIVGWTSTSPDFVSRCHVKVGGHVKDIEGQYDGGGSHLI